MLPCRRVASSGWLSGPLVLACLVAACGDSNDADPVADTGSDTVEDVAVDAVEDSGPDADAGDTGDDAADDTGTDVDAADALDVDAADSTVEAPFVPEPPAAPYVDRPFVQEWNHTTPEVNPDLVPAVDVVFRPALFEGWDEVIYVRPDGIVRSVEGESVEFVAVDLPDGERLLGAGTTPDAIIAASPGRIFIALEDGTVNTATPSGTVRRVVQGVDAVWLLTDAGLSRVDAAVIAHDADAPMLDALAEDDEGVVAAWDGTIGRWANWGEIGTGEPEWQIVSAEDPGFEALVLDVTLPDAFDVVAFTADGVLAVRVSESGAELVAEPLFAADRVPLRGAVEAVRTGDGGVLAVGPEGAWRIMDRGDGPEWRVYPAERWLPDEDVRGVASEAPDELSTIYFATAAGPARVTAEWMTLEEKMAYFAQRVVERHDRDGAVADSRFTERGDVATNIPWDSDNDGGWTCYWILAECSRWLETGAQDARDNFDRSLERMLSFQTLTGTEHFLARSVIRRDGCQLDDCDDPDDGEWFLSPDEEWWVKGDTSNDEVISHMFMMGPAYDWCATEDQRAAIRQHVTRIVGGIIDNGWQLIDLDGEVTRYGQLNPEFINGTFGAISSDGGRRSVAALGIATLAHHVSGEQRFLDARQVLIDEHGYADNAVRTAEYPLFGGEYSGDNIELSMQAWMSLLRYETDADYLAMWRDGWDRTYAVMDVQQGAMWDVANHVLGGPDTSIANIARWLRLAPMDFIRWNIHNSHRRDLVAPPSFYEQSGRQRSDERPIPYDERSLDRWNTDQYRIDRGHDGWREMDGADVLAPYWLARRYGLIVPE